MRGLRRLGWVALGCGFMLAPAVGVAAGEGAQDQQQMQEPGLRSSSPDQAAACPMMDASNAAKQAVKEGAQVRVENTPDGAIVRFAAPSGNQQALQDSRTAAQQLADAAQAGCACQGGMQGRDQSQPSGGMPGGGMRGGGGM